jgi:hypothetical protein
VTEAELDKMKDDIKDLRALLVGVQGDNGLNSRIKILEKRLDEATQKHVLGYQTESSKMWQAIELTAKALDLYKYTERNETCNWVKSEKDVASRLDDHKNTILLAIKTIKDKEQSDKTRFVQMTGIIIAASTGILGAVLNFLK